MMPKLMIQTMTPSPILSQAWMPIVIPYVTIDSTDGEALIQSADHETKDSYTFDVTASDGVSFLRYKVSYR